MQDSKGQIYSYKTLLCECEELDHAWQINELLRRHGIQSWIGKPSFANVEFPLGPRVEVAADQLEQAKLIIAQPMPQEIIDEFREMNEDVREYEPPKCPQCGAEDPILENAEPVNQWLCESCGKQWSEGAVEVN
jgi:transposase